MNVFKTQSQNQDQNHDPILHVIKGVSDHVLVAVVVVVAVVVPVHPIDPPAVVDGVPLLLETYVPLPLLLLHLLVDVVVVAAAAVAAVAGQMDLAVLEPKLLLVDVLLLLLLLRHLVLQPLVVDPKYSVANADDDANEPIV